MKLKLSILLFLSFFFACDPAAPVSGPDGSTQVTADGSTSTDALAPGDTQIQARVATTPDGLTSTLGYHDTLLGVDCTFSAFADGVTRCYPATLSPGYYSDPECTVPVAYAFAGCSDDDLPRFILSSPGACSTLLTVFERGTEINPPVLYLDAGDSCLETSTSPTFRYFLYGPSVSPDVFERATISL